MTAKNGKFEVLIADEENLGGGAIEMARWVLDSIELTDEYIENVGVKSGTPFQLAMRRALVRAGDTGKAVAIATIREEYDIKKSTVGRNFRVVKPKGYRIHKAPGLTTPGVETGDDLSVSVVSKGPMLPLVQYRVSPRRDTAVKGKKRTQVRVAVKKKGGLKPLKNSFIYKGRVLQRLGTKSLPVEMKYGPAIPIAASNQVVVDNVSIAMQDKFYERLEHEVNYILSGGNVDGLRNQPRG